jgi:hypothetical protein
MFHTTRQARGLLLAGMLLSALVGCSDARKLVPVQGQVFYNDKPLAFGNVMFQPENGQAASGNIQPDGTFVLETPGEGAGAPIGRSQVRITCYESQGPSAEVSTQTEPGLGKLLIPAKYTNFATSELTVEVKPDGNEPFVFRLTDK